MGMKFVVLVVIVLVIIAVAQIMRVYELSSKVRGKREEDIDLRTNNMNASMMIVFLLVFFGSFFYMLFAYGRGMLPGAASEIGQEIDWLFNINWIIVITIFLLTNALLFIFAWKYSYHPDRKAHWFPHDNKLEMIWTVVPAGALAVIIILGLMTWNEITGEASADAQMVEIYGEQFSWTARYSGDDNKLGFADYQLVGTAEDKKSGVSYTNPLGVVTQNSIRWSIKRINDDIEKIDSSLAQEARGEVVFSEAKFNTMVAKVEKLERIRERVLDMQTMYGDSINAYAQDDFIAKELFLVKDQEYMFILRSKDVLHSAYFPHFRAQMNCVPGQRTKLRVKPIYTTAEMRERDDVEDPNFNFILMCNKICGVSHSNMKMNVIVGTQEEYNEWIATQGNTSPAINDTIVAPTDINVERMEMPEPAHHGDHGGDHGDEGHHDEEGDAHADEHAH